MTTLVLISPGSNRETNLSMNNIQFIEEHSVSNVVIFSVQSSDNSSLLMNEFEDLGISSKIIKLKQLSTKGMEYSDQLRTLSWEISKQIIHAFNDIESPIILLGRGSTLHDHLLWIISSSSHCKQYHWDGVELDTYHYDHKYLKSQVAPLVISGILELSGRTSLYEFTSEEIAELDDISEMSGIQSATKPCIQENLITVNRGGSGSPTYKLTNKGFPVALKHWTEGRFESDRQINKRMLITFDRLPDSDSRFNFPSITSKISPHDSYLFIFQKYISDITINGVYTFSEVLENQELIGIHDEINRCKTMLESKKHSEEFEMVEPLLILNPNSSKEFSLSLNFSLFKSIRQYEYSYDEHILTFDITSCMSTIRSFISKFAVATKSKICYVVKSSGGISATGLQVQQSPFSRSDHVLDVPSSIAIEAINSLPKSRINALVVMHYFENGEFNEDVDVNDIEELLLAGETVDNKKGLTWKEIYSYGDELNSIKGTSIGIDDNSNRLKSLISHQLITRVNPTENKFILTELGEWVASWQINHLGME